MSETTAEYHYLLLAVASARRLIIDLPDHKIRDDLDDLKLRSFVFLCHAALEEYLERVSIYVLQECQRNFSADRRVALPLAAACSYYGVPLVKKHPSFLNFVVAGEAFEFFTGKVLELHRVAVSEVNGIKTKDQDSIFLPIGIRIHDFDHLLSQSLNSFGEGRGRIAHEFRIMQKLPKMGLDQNVQNIVDLLEKFDNELCEMISVYYEMR